ncbi:MAG: molybdopterin converting factor subunit 1 [Hyphomonadaceae bacterium]|nr:molybdopterin converting factor subunit 1 [Hyphomonadaceae bacterium]
MARILYFGRLSDLTGAAEETVALPDTVSTAGELRQFLDLRFEANGALLEPTVRIAINNELCFDTMAVTETDEIAFMPPVGGG